MRAFRVEREACAAGFRAAAGLLMVGAALTAAANVEAQAIRRLEGRHLTLLTDLPSSPEVDRLPRAFDEAVPQWAEFFRVDPKRVADWHLTGCLMADRQRFRAAGLLGSDVPEFRHGYCEADRLWLDDQPSDYYRRHLLLHEGTHGFQQAFAGAGPPWQQEGVAELLATHRLDEQGRVVLGVFPARKEDVPRWGRIGLVRRAIEDGRALTLPEVLAFGPSAHQEDEAYAWCWALCVLLDRDPRYGDALREAAHDPGAMQKLNEALAADASLRWPWREFTSGLEYGFDLDKASITPSRKAPQAVDRAEFTVGADRGWQATGCRLEAGQGYALRATGRFVVAKADRDWVSEPPGVSIRYHAGRPLGQLLAAVVDDEGVAETWAVGSRQTIMPPRSGTLFLKINDSPAELADNRGEVRVEIRRQ